MLTLESLRKTFPFRKFKKGVDKTSLNEIAGYKVIERFIDQEEGYYNATEVLVKAFPGNRFGDHWLYFRRDGYKEIPLDIADWLMNRTYTL